MNRRNLFFSSGAAALALSVLPLVAQDAKTPKAPAAKKEEAKPAAQAKAEKIILSRLQFGEAYLQDCLDYFGELCEVSDPEKVPERRGLICLNRVAGRPAKPVTLELKNVSAWEAAQKIAAAADVEVTATDQALWFHQKGAAPVQQPSAAAWRKSKEWQAAEKITLNEVTLVDASTEQVCSLLNKRAAAAGKHAKIPGITAERFDKGITMVATNVKLTDALLIVAQMAQAEISVSDGKILLRPAPKVEE
jgi:hypothetical protein